MGQGGTILKINKHTNRQKPFEKENTPDEKKAGPYLAGKKERIGGEPQEISRKRALPEEKTTGRAERNKIYINMPHLSLHQSFSLDDRKHGRQHHIQEIEALRADAFKDFHHRRRDHAVVLVQARIALRKAGGGAGGGGGDSR